MQTKGDTTSPLSPVSHDQHNLCMAKGKKTAEGVEAGQRIKATREQLGWSLAYLSRQVNKALTGPAIGNYEQGTRKINMRIARLLGTAMGAHPAYLMGLLDEDEHRFLKALKPERYTTGGVAPFPKKPPEPPHPVPPRPTQPPR